MDSLAAKLWGIKGMDIFTDRNAGLSKIMLVC